MTEKHYTVIGMTCQHCVKAVSTECGSIAGVREVDVDLATGRLTVRGDHLTDATDAHVRDAVDEAGYAVA